MEIQQERSWLPVMNIGLTCHPGLGARASGGACDACDAFLDPQPRASFTLVQKDLLALLDLLTLRMTFRLWLSGDRERNGPQELGWN